MSHEWDAWIEAHAPGLLFFARQQCRSEADAQDVLQDAIVECWQHQPEGQPPPLARVYATIRLRAIDLARQASRRTNRETQAGPAADACWFDVPAEDRERAMILHEAMLKLTDIHREVVALKIWGGLTFAEIAEALQIPANTAASRYRYGLEALREQTREVLA